MRTSVKITAYLILAGLILALLLLVAEFSFRSMPEYARAGFIFDEKMIYTLTPNFAATKPYAANKVGKEPFLLKFNNYGCRGEDFQKRKQEGTQRILMLGDSYQAGLDYPDEDIFPFIWEDRLNKNSDHKYEIYNASCPAWGTDQQYIFWKNSGRSFQPDHVVICFSPNDIREMYNHGVVDIDNGEIKLKEVALPADERRGWAWACRSSTYQYLQKNTFKTNYGDFPRVFHHFPVNYGVKDSTDWDMPLFLANTIDPVAKSYEMFEILLKDIQKDCKADGIQLHLVKLPIEIEYDDTYQDSLFSKTIVEENIEKIAERNQIPFTNLNGALRAEENPLGIFMDWEYHYDQEGHQWVADQLLKNVQL